jgi:hypothetical protein
MIAKRILAGAFATAALLACAGCTAQELAAMHASAATNADEPYHFPDETFPPAPPTAMSSDSAPPMPTLPTGPALDPASGHLLVPIGPRTYADPTTGAVFPPGSPVIPQ